ncbi:DUF4974 domain-containing protein [Pedobacter sp. KBS0701]|uniref:FecR family protein n=1 Tax=Pedobacter sp. KBS0701 TaxID=2578106 RepID=UPI00110F4ADD|nr:FecR family protein [Pedobacter sp. KBS0701]QDW25168.1 DUF4974 domain-containing protein [Pedobacter sp. KBS0701]
MQQQISKSLIKKFLAKECTEDERTVVIKALNTAAGQRLFDEVLLAGWDAPRETEEISDLQLFRWNQELHQRVEQIAGTKVIKWYHSNLLRYAGVSVAVIVGLAFFIHKNISESTENMRVAIRHISNPHGKRSIITLPDSSIVYLGAGSKISFPEKFADEQRNISLEGEAFFDVKHKPQQAFIVRTGDLQTRDIGTSFQIFAFKNHPVKVALASGEVSVERLKDRKIQVLARLVPGQQCVWDNKKLSTSTVPTSDISGWKDGHLVFDGVSLSELTAVLERWYDVKFIFTNRSRKQLSVTTRLTVEKTPITAVIQALSIMEHFTYKVRGRQIIIN